MFRDDLMKTREKQVRDMERGILQSVKRHMQEDLRDVTPASLATFLATTFTGCKDILAETRLDLEGSKAARFFDNEIAFCRQNADKSDFIIKYTQHIDALLDKLNDYTD